MSRDIAAEHRGLQPLFEETRAALQAATPRAQEPFDRLRAALKTHFAQEERLYYPAIWALRPEHKAALHDFLEAHAAFLDALADIADQLERGALGEAEGAFAVFVESYTPHEDREEELLRDLEREWAARPERGA